MPIKMHYSDLSVGGDGGHGDGGDDGDDVGEDDHGEALEDAGLAHHPGQPQEQHHAPDVQETSQVHSLQAASLCNTIQCIAMCRSRPYLEPAKLDCCLLDCYRLPGLGVRLGVPAAVGGVGWPPRLGVLGLQRALGRVPQLLYQYCDENTIFGEPKA